VQKNPRHLRRQLTLDAIVYAITCIQKEV